MTERLRASDASRLAHDATRWVASPALKIPRTRHGLLDSEAINNEWYAGDRPSPVGSLVGIESSYVLLAPGGAGKSTLVDTLRHREQRSDSVDLRMHGRESLAATIRGVSLSARSVFIDALDEALQADPNLGYMLVKLLAEADAQRVGWRLACRPGSWTLDLAKGLRDALPGFQELELLPLDRSGIEEMAGDNAELFLTAVDHARLTGQLAQPLMARALLEQWRSTGSLPATRSEAMQHTVGRLLEEVGDFRQPRRQGDKRTVLVAERLGAITIFCGVGRFGLGPGTPVPFPNEASDAPTGAVLPVGAVPVDDEPDLSGSPLSVGDVREVLSAPLFSAAGEGTVAFVHQSYAEYLSARYLTRRGVGGSRLLSLLGADTNGLAPGPLIEVLSWMLALGGDVPGDLIRANAKALLQTAGLELANDQIRARVVDALLLGAANGTIDEGWRVDCSVLAYEGLGTRLHDAVAEAVNPWEIFWVARIARDCVVFEVTDDLLGIARSASWPDFIRVEAIRSFADLAPRDRIVELDSLLELGPDEDPRDEILAAALRATLRGQVDVDRLATVLRPRRSTEFLGDYAMVLRALPAQLRDADALQLLTVALTHQPSKRDSSYLHMVSALLARVWDTADDSAFGQVGTLIGRNRHMLTELRRDDALPWESNDRPGPRKAMAAAALATGGDSFVPVLQLRILTHKDAVWLIDWMEDAPSEALRPACVVLHHLATAVQDATTADAILAVTEPHPAYGTLSHFQGSTKLDARPDWLPRETALELRPSREDLLVSLRNAIAVTQEDVGAWWRSAVALAGDLASGDADSLYAWDLTTRPLWVGLERSEQDEFWRLAMDYLAVVQPMPEHWTGIARWNLSDVMPDWTAVFALATLAVHRPEDLAQIPHDIWVKWALAIVSMPAFTDVATWQPALGRTVPLSARAALTDAVKEFVGSGEASSFAHHPLADFSDRGLLGAITEVANGVGQSRERRDEALETLVREAPTTALEVARAALTESNPPDGVAYALAKLAPDELLASRLAAGPLSSLESLSRVDLELLSDGGMAELASRLLDELPFANDPPRYDGFVQVTPESEARRLRIHVLQALSARGMSAHLAMLAQGRPPADVAQILHFLQRAREREALRNWRPLEAGTMMRLVAQGDARLVRDSAGLLTVLIEQLEHIQRRLQEKASFRSLWDGEPGDDGASPKLEDDISDWLVEQLELRLSPHVVVDREVQVSRPSRRGIGTRIDVTVTAPGGVRLARVAFEAKRVENSSLLTALGNQLVRQYMEPAELSHGIYIVYWVDPAVRPPKWRSPNRDALELARTLRGQADQYRPVRQVEVVVLNIGPVDKP